MSLNGREEVKRYMYDAVLLLTFVTMHYRLHMKDVQTIQLLGCLMVGLADWLNYSSILCI